VIEMPARLPIRFAITYTVSTDGAGNTFLLVGSNPEVVATALSNYSLKNGLVHTAQFRRAFAGLPMKNNGIKYVSRRFSETLRNVRLRFVDLCAPYIAENPSRLSSLKEWVRRMDLYSCAMVTANWKDGILIEGRTSAGGGEFLLSSLAGFWAEMMTV
ncbi:MAG: hypothetical protein ACOC6C_04465, partial [Verrucomicrobiota bacterium]